MADFQGKSSPRSQKSKNGAIIDSAEFTLFLLIRIQFIRNEISAGKNFKKLESWILGNLRNFSFRKQKNTKIFLIFGMKITKYDPKLRNF